MADASSKMVNAPSKMTNALSKMVNDSSKMVNALGKSKMADILSKLTLNQDGMCIDKAKGYEITK